jgi:hypothetical protein
MTRYILIGASLVVLAGAIMAQSYDIQPPVDFFQEEITLTVTDSTAAVSGVYHFRNNTARDFDMPVAFPFYVDSLSAYPHFIEAYIEKESGKQVLPHRQLTKMDGISLKIPLKAGQEMTWNLDYAQKISSKRAVYIITSTAAWKKPLEQATYTFIAPANFINITAWPTPDTSFVNNGIRSFISYKQGFMPVRDMEILWK